jgi:Uncharacterized conserved protein (DUF2163)
MRTFTGGDGADTTAAVLAYLAAARQLRLADLYLIGEQEDPKAIWLTSWESPLAWPVWGTFQPAKITRDKITSQIGLEVSSLKLEWSPKLTAFGTSIATANPYQKAQMGVYDNQRVRLWRCVMPTPGDANTYGACELFGGRIGDTIIERGSITFTVNSFLDVVNQPVPPNVIEAANTMAGFVGHTPVLADGETNVPTFTVVAPSTPDLILGDCIQPTAHKIYGLNKFILGFMVFRAGSSLAGFWSPVAANQNFNAGGGIHYNQFQAYAAFPWAPTPGDTFYVSTQWPVDYASATAGQFKGFPFVPNPIAAA